MITIQGRSFFLYTLSSTLYPLPFALCPATLKAYESGTTKGIRSVID